MKKFKNLSRFPELEHVVLTRENAEAYFQQENVAAQQIHEAKVAWVKTNTKSPVKGVDALITQEKNIWLSIHTADCLPIIIYHPKRRIVAVVHAGWRSTVYNIVQETIESMKVDPYDLIVGIGPGICEQCFCVGPEVAQYFNEQGKSCIDLQAVNKKQLMDRGVLEKNIEIIKGCTFEDEKNYFSYRRGDRDKRQGIFAKLK